MYIQCPSRKPSIRQEIEIRNFVNVFWGPQNAAPILKKSMQSTVFATSVIIVQNDK